MEGAPSRNLAATRNLHISKNKMVRHPFSGRSVQPHDLWVGLRGVPLSQVCQRCHTYRTNCPGCHSSMNNSELFSRRTRGLCGQGRGIRALFRPLSNKHLSETRSQFCKLLVRLLSKLLEGSLHCSILATCLGSRMVDTLIKEPIKRRKALHWKVQVCTHPSAWPRHVIRKRHAATACDFPTQRGRMRRAPLHTSKL